MSPQRRLIPTPRTGYAPTCSATRVTPAPRCLLASHNMLEVERLCDHVLMLKGGRIFDEGSPATLISRYGRVSLEEVFLDIARGKGAQNGLGSAAQ